ncbi:MAG TPA: carboxypeptidase-like regulatory domain-containing protein, partial [Thermoanaerobaculia bacterium]|nr:carboxypeptidase-like regulatory domain-containing protein [Thermoanaerobaculia bacterium]
MKFRRIFAALIVTIAATHAALAANITSTSLRIQGAGLRVLTESVVTGIDLPASVQTEFGGKTNDEATAPEELTVVGDLTGPGLDTPVPLTTAPGHKFEIPGLKQIGTYYLQNIRLMNGTEFLQYATPSVVTITVSDLLQTKVTVKQLTPEEIRARGIVVDARNFDVYEYSFTFIIKDQEVVVPFPVIIDPRTHEAFPVASESPYKIPSDKIIEPPRWTPPQIIATEFGEESDGFDWGKDPLEKNPKGAPFKIPAAIVIPNSLAVLHQFFAVGIVVTNGAPADSDARLENIYANIKIPTALRTVKTEPTVAMGAAVPIVEPKTGVTFLLAQGRGEAEWTLEGLHAGTYPIDIDLHATLKRTGQDDLALHATPRASVVVHDPRFNITFSHPDTVRKGIEYSTYAFITNMSGTEQTITVASGVQGCDVNPNGNVCRLSGAVSDLITIPANDMRVIEYRLRSNVIGHVFATAGTLDDDEHLSAKVQLTMGVSETGIPLSPVTLILPYYAQFVEPDVVSANLQLFGLGFSLATAPVNAMTAKFPRVIQTDVFQRAVDLSRAGQRIFISNSNAEVKRDSLVHMTLDLLGNGGHDLREWDALRRQEKSGRMAGAAGARQLEATGLANGATMRDFIDSMASATAWRSGYVAVLAHGAATGDRPYAVSLTGRSSARSAQLPNEAEAAKWVRTLPYSDIDQFNGAGENGELAMMGRWVEDLDASVTPAADGQFSVEVIYPNTADGTLLKAHFDLTGHKGETLTIPITRGDSALDALLPNGGIASTGSVSTVSPQPLTLLGARQDLYLDENGHKVSVLYNRPVSTPEGVDLLTRFDGEIDFNKDSVVFKGPRPLSSAALQEDRRTVNLTFDHVLSINADYTLASGNMIDPTTSAEVSFPEKVAIKIDNASPAAILYGKVLKGDNTPIPHSEITIRQYKTTDGKEPSVPPQWDVTNADGAFLFEYVRREIEAYYGGAYRAVAVTPDGKTTTIEGSVRLPNKVHFLNIQLLGRGSAEGYVRYDNGEVAAGARVTVGSTMFNIMQGVEADAKGYYRIDDLPVGPLTFSAIDKDGNTTFAAAEIATPGQLVTQNLSIYRKPFPG